MYKLVIADDEYEIRTGLANYFPWDNIGFEVVYTAKDGKEALDYLLTHPVDVLICDIRMPVMTGIDLVKEIYDSKINIKTIFLSGYKEFEYAKKAISYGVKNYIVKPTKYNEIIDVFSKIKLELDEEYAEKQEIKNHITDEPEKHEKEDVCAHDKIVGYIKSYVNKNYKNATLEEIAQNVYMNPDYLSKFFKQKTGQNFSDYLTVVRMKKAAELLSNIKYKTYEISDMVGYSNSHNFTRAFKKYYGVAPREYRYSQNTSTIEICTNEGKINEKDEIIY